MRSGTYGSVPLRAAPPAAQTALPPSADSGGSSSSGQRPSSAPAQVPPPIPAPVPVPLFFDRSSSINDFFFTFDYASGNVWGLVYLLAAFAVGALGWHYSIVVILAWCITSYCFQHSRRKHMDTIFSVQSALQDPDVARRIMGNYLPAWLCFSEPEKSAWLQTIINNMWPNIAEAVKNDVLESVNPLLDSYRPKAILNVLKLTVFDLGDVPIVVDGVSASLSGNDTVIDMYFHWNSNADIHLIAEAIGGVEVEAVIHGLQYQSVARLFLGPHCSAWPCFGCFSVTFVGKPVLDFGIKAAKIPLEAIPGFSSWLRGFVEQMLSWSLTYPNRLVFPLFNDMGKMKLMERTVDPIGRLTIQIVGADGIPESFFQKRKTYVQGTRTNGDARTSISKRTSASVTGKSPRFGECLVFPVYKAPNERIELALMADETKPPVIGNMLIKDNVIGLLTISVGSLLDHENIEITRRLVNPAKTTADVGTLTIVATFCQFEDRSREAEQEYDEGFDAHADATRRFLQDADQPTLEEAAMQDASSGQGSSGAFPRGRGSAPFEARRRSSSASRLRQSITRNVPIRGLLMVDIVSCSNLPKADLVGSSDPYVKIRLGRQMEQTEHVSNNLNPVYNVQKQFDVDDVARDVLEVEVHDYDRIKVKKRLLCAVNIDVKSVFEAGGAIAAKSYQLSGRGGSTSGGGGSIMLGLRLLVNQEKTSSVQGGTGASS